MGQAAGSAVVFEFSQRAGCPKDSSTNILALNEVNGSADGAAGMTAPH